MIEVAGLTKRFGDFAAVDGVSFAAKTGEILGFLGPNGAGKTTTMRILTGYMPATSGTAKIAGFDVNEKPEEVRRRIGYLPEHPPLYEDLTVRVYLDFVGKLKGLRGKARRGAVDDILPRCGLAEVADRRIGHLSKGYKQRVGLAQALVHNPPVLILDEPTIGLDPAQIVEIRGLIRGLAGGHTVILSTHILPEVTQICDRVVVIRRGKVVADDTFAALAGRFADAAAREGGAARETRRDAVTLEEIYIRLTSQ